MSETDAQIAAGPSLSRLGELGRAVARGIRGLTETDTSSSFASSLASASLAAEGDDTGPGNAPADGEVTRGGRKPGDAPQLGSTSVARSGRDRALGPSLATTPESAPPDARAAQAASPARPPVISAIRPEGRSFGPVPASSGTGVATSATASGPASTPTATTSQGATATVPATPAAALPSTSTPATTLTATATPSISAAAIQATNPVTTSPATSTASRLPPTANSSTTGAPALGLEEYPKPTRGDRSGVLNWTSVTPPTGQDLDRLVAEARHRQVGWVTFAADPQRLDEYGDLADRLTRAGIQPIARVQDPDGDLPASEVSALVKELRGHGVRYFQLFDGANVADQTPDYRVDVPDYAQRWLAAAKAVVAGGGLPGIGALAPDGDYDDLGFMRQLLNAVKERGGTDVLGQSWLALRGEAPGASATTTNTNDLADRAGWFDRVSRQALGRSLPILATLDPAGPSERLAADPASPTPTPLVEQSERALHDRQRKLPALFAASRGTLEAARA